MKVPLTYPKIPDNRNCPLKQCIAFNKYDGTNIFISYDTEYDYWSFGTRRDQFSLTDYGIKSFNEAHIGLEEVPILIKELLNSGLEKHLLNYSRYDEIKVFAEFFGNNSFAGRHDPNDKKQLVIFDVMIDGKILPPEQFINDFNQFNIAKVIYKGKYTGQFTEDVRKGKYNVNEGVVVKGVVDNQIYMIKIKTDAYMKRLQTEFKDNWKDYWE